MPVNERRVLLTPGPVTLSERVRTALRNTALGHREPAFADLTRDINQRLVRVYRETAKDFGAVSLTGSGTAAVEGMLASFIPEGSPSLVLVNGSSGERMAQILERHGKPFESLEFSWTAAPDAERVRAALENERFDRVIAVHHETTSGRLNDFGAIGALCKERKIPLFLDAVGSFGVESIRVDEWNVGAIAGSAGKCLHGVPGMAFVLARRALWEPPAEPPATLYLDLHAYHAAQNARGAAPFTQAVPAAHALRAALIELEDQGGWEQRRSIYRVRAGRIAVALKRLGLETLLPPQDCSCALWAWRLPDGDTYRRVEKALGEHGFVLSPPPGGLKENIFRISHMGDIHNSDLDNLVAALEACFGQPAPAGVRRL